MPEAAVFPPPILKICVQPATIRVQHDRPGNAADPRGRPIVNTNIDPPQASPGPPHCFPARLSLWPCLALAGESLRLHRRGVENADATPYDFQARLGIEAHRFRVCLALELKNTGRE